MSWAAVAGAGATIIGGEMQGRQNAAATGAANENNVAIENARLKQQAQVEDARLGQDWQKFGTGAKISNEASQSMRDYAGENLGGYNEAGQAATKQMQALLGMGTPGEQAAAQAAIQESPGQKFMRDRAQKNLLRSSAAIGGLGGGNVRTALVEQGAGFAAQDLNNQFSRLQGLAGQGLSAGQSIVGKDLGVSGTAGGVGSSIGGGGIGVPDIIYTAPEQGPGMAGRLAEYDLGGNILGGVDNTFGTKLRGSLADPVATVGKVFGGGGK